MINKARLTLGCEHQVFAIRPIPEIGDRFLCKSCGEWVHVIDRDWWQMVVSDRWRRGYGTYEAAFLASIRHQNKYPTNPVKILDGRGNVVKTLEPSSTIPLF